MPLFHVWFATKRRKWILLGEVQEAAKRELEEIARDRGIRLLECEAIVDHVHLLLEVSDKGMLPRAMNDLKGISARHLFLAFPELKLDAQANHFWQEGYGAKLVPAGAIEPTKRYIQTQWERTEGYDRPAKLRPSGRSIVQGVRSKRS
jgi:REP-associated tyrosine transposase